MSPIVGSLAGLSARSLGWGLSAPAATFELIQTQVLASSAASVTFSSLGSYASTYKHLQLRVTARVDNAGTTEAMGFMRFNGDTATNYSWHGLLGTGSAASAQNSVSTTGMWAVNATGPTQATGYFSGSVVDILDAFNTSKNKTIRGLSGNSTIDVFAYSGVWYNSSSLSSITLIPQITASWNYIAGSRFSLYGVRG